MINYRELFEQLISELRQNKIVELVTSILNPGISQQEMNGSNEPLPSFVTDFYSQLNGVTIQWKIRNSLPGLANKVQDKLTEAEQATFNNGGLFGSINILPFRKVFQETEPAILRAGSYKESFDFNGVEYSGPSFARILKPFDLISDYYAMAIVYSEKHNYNVMLLSDYYIEWDYSLLSTFETYIDIILLTKGIISLRGKIFRKYRGDKLPAIDNPEVARPYIRSYDFLFSNSHLNNQS